MSIGERIKEIRGNLSRDDFASPFGVIRNSVQRYENDEREPKLSFIIDVCEKYEINIEWLVTGNGPKFIKDKPKATIDQEILTDAIAALETALQTKGKVIKPEAKAEIIAEIYQMFIEDEEGKNKDSFARILSLVA